MSAKLLFLGAYYNKLAGFRKKHIVLVFMFVFLFGTWASGVMMCVVFLGVDI